MTKRVPFHIDKLKQYNQFLEAERITMKLKRMYKVGARRNKFNSLNNGGLYEMFLPR